MRKIKIIAVSLIAGIALTGCAQVGAVKANFEKRVIDGTECVVGTSSDGGVAVDCDWSE